VVVVGSHNEILHSVDKVVHDFKVTILHRLAVGHGRQKVVEDRHEEVHDHDNHCEQVEDQKEAGGLSTVIHHRVQAELSQHRFHLCASFNFNLTGRLITSHF